MNMIEKMATALFEHDWERKWNDKFMQEYERKHYYKLAKIAIEAMREPTSKMQNDYYEMRMATGHGKMQSCFPFAVWECAVDAALKEE